MKLLLTLLIVLVAIPAFAGVPPLPFDGNGNVYPVEWNGSAWVYVSDSVDIGQAFGSTDSMPVKGTVYIGGSPTITIDSEDYSPLYVQNIVDGIWRPAAADGAAYDGCTIATSAMLYTTACQVGYVESEDKYYRVRQNSSVTDVECTTSLAGGASPDTFTLDGVYDMIYVSSDTDIIIALTSTEANNLLGDMAYAGITTPYSFRTDEIYIRTKSGLVLGSGYVAVRGMR